LRFWKDSYWLRYSHCDGNGQWDAGFPGRELFDKACVAMAIDSGDKSLALGELSAALGDAVEK
jgi:hypothetical protein